MRSMFVVFRAQISIHALREESDGHFLYLRRTKEISIHALREESDRLYMSLMGHFPDISIHALREESDRNRRNIRYILAHFYPRSP